MKTITLKIDGMSCGHCVNSIETAIKQAGGSATVDLKTASVTITFDDAKVSATALAAAITEQGYEIVK